MANPACTGSRYGDVYSNAPRTPQPVPAALGGGRVPVPQQILPVDLPPQAFLTSSMLLDMVDSPYAQYEDYLKTAS